MKQSAEKISMVTCYDSSFAKLVEKSPVDAVLVGDSLGNVMLGQKNTLAVTMSDMCRHTRAVSQVLSRPFLIADMPFMSYQLGRKQALKNAGILIAEGGAAAVKLEGGQEILPQVRALTAAGIPVCGHLGLTPQKIHQLGGFKVQGRENEARRIIKEDALALQDAGIFCLVLELLDFSLAEELTKILSVPTIGIGSGPACDGQVLVLHDLLGFDPDFNPKFLKKYANLAHIIGEALAGFDSDVKTKLFPVNPATKNLRIKKTWQINAITMRF